MEVTFLMKIGIITYQRAENFGAALQCRALYEYLRTKGHDVEIIDYRNPIIEKSYNLLPRLRKNLFKYVESYIFVLFNYKDLKEKKKKFHDFFYEEKRSPSMTYDELLSTELDYDLIITGSDQIWNPSIHKFFDKVYYLQISGNFRRAAYSASTGNIHREQFESKEFERYLRRYDHISIRESDAAQFIENKLKRPILHTVDPTLLLDRYWWDELIKNIHMHLPKKYIFVYDLLSHCDVPRSAKEISKKYGIPIVRVASDRQYRIGFGNHVISIVNSGPLELVYLIKNANMVISSSFHGVAISCIYRKDLYMFIPFERKGTDTRVSNIAELYGIQNRIFYTYDEFMRCLRAGGNKILFDESSSSEMIERSKNYLAMITGEGEKH